MKVSQLLFFTFAGALLGLSHGQICPPPEALSPCTCTERSKDIHCVEIQDPNFRLKEVFDRASEFIGEDVVFENLIIRSTAIKEIEEGAVNNLRFKRIQIVFNRNLEWISPKAFGGTTNVTTYLSLIGSNLTHDAHRETDIFEFVNSFENVITMELVDNGITFIPSNAFRNLTLLEDINLVGNLISHLGNRSFSWAPRLKEVILNMNSIPSEGLSADAFEGISSLAHVSLMWNGHDFMEQKSYETLLDQASAITVGSRTCVPDPDDFRCWHNRDFNCDERADWICEKEDVYRPKLYGFLCKEDTGFEDVWEYCRNRNLIHIH